MISINSLSGGRTSSYMAMHYPADYNIFCIIKIDDIKCQPNDKTLIKKIEMKINDEFIATAEDDKTLYLMFDLEQKIGKEIIWLHGQSFDALIKSKRILPNKFKRFCTIEMKMKPIYNWWKQNFNEIVEMRIGYRYDELERKERFTTTYKDIIGKSKSGLRNKWKDIEWRIGKFPLIEDKILNYHIKKWSLSSGLNFPNDSNCIGCFWKHEQQLRKNWEENPLKMQWFANQETKKTSWIYETTYEKIKHLPLQSEFEFGTGAGCQAGFCTD